MFSSGTIHVFIGAPVIPSVSNGTEENGLVDPTEEWEEISYVSTPLFPDNCDTTKSKDIQEPSSHHGKQTSPNGTLFKYGDFVSETTSFISPFHNCEKEKQSFTELSSLLSIKQHCNITPHSQILPENLGNILQEYLDASFPKKSANVGVQTHSETFTSTDTEFLAVLTSSQVAILHHGEICEQDASIVQPKITNSNHCRVDESQRFTPLLPKENAETKCFIPKDMQGYSDCSLELFTPTSSDIKCYQAPCFKQIMQHQERVSFQELSSTCVGEQNANNNSEHFKNATCKRQKSWDDSAVLYPLTIRREHNSKKVKLSDSLDKSDSKMSPGAKQMHPKQAKDVIPLKYCSDKTKEYSILACVLHPCYLKEIQIKTGPNAGFSVPLATIVVFDQSNVERKVVLWRSAAFWTLTVLPGDIIILTDLIVCEDRWNKETLLQSTAVSRLKNLGNYSSLCPKDGSDMVDIIVPQALLEHISMKYHYLTTIRPRRTQNLDSIPYVRLDQLQPETMVHAILKVSGISILTECMYRYKGQRQNKVILTVEENKWSKSTLVLWGASTSWCDQIQLKRDHIWEFRHLFTRRNPDSDDLELHTTPWSSCECLFDDDSRATDFHKRYLEEGSPTKHMDLITLLEEKCSCVVQLKASISELEFLVPSCQNIVINEKDTLSDIMESLPAIVYSGCGRCKRELKTDENYIYEQCFFCLPFSQVKMLYRPALMTAVSGDSLIRVHVPSNVLEKIFLNISPNILDKVIVGTTDVTNTAIVADLCHSLLLDTGETYILKIRSHFVLDENSITLDREFHLLDFHITY
ncbi:shieldin complex subunit 2 [Rhinophrynus dorsalis]